MKVYEIKVKVFILSSIKLEQTLEKISMFIDMCMAKENLWLEYHKSRQYKEYTFSSFLPLEKEKQYFKDKVYTFKIRTINEKLAKYLYETLSKFRNNDMQGLTSEIKILQKKMLKKIYSITPILMKSDGGYWKYCMSFEEFEKRLQVNCIKKWRYFCNILKDEKNMNIELYTGLRFLNIKPVPIYYKNMILRGDKIELTISNHPIAQEIAYMILGTGLLENSSRGLGYVNYQYY